MPDAGRWFREPFGIDQDERGFVYRLQTCSVRAGALRAEGFER